MKTRLCEINKWDKACPELCGDMCNDWCTKSCKFYTNNKDAQFKALKKYTISRLNEVVNLIHMDKFDEVESMLSSLEDDYGTEKYYIRFEIHNGFDDKSDLYEVLNLLRHLKEL